MKHLLVAYYSRTGNTKKLAEQVAAGAREVDDLEVALAEVDQVTNDDLLRADAIIIGSPVYYGNMAGAVVNLFDRSVTIRNQMQDKVGAAFASSGHHTGGKETTIMGILQAMLISGMIVMGDPLNAGGHYGVGCVGAPDQEAEVSAKALGKRVGEFLAKAMPD